EGFEGATSATAASRLAIHGEGGARKSWSHAGDGWPERSGGRRRNRGAIIARSPRKTLKPRTSQPVARRPVHRSPPTSGPAEDLGAGAVGR
ncbi:hypothetical protein ACRAWD_28805, partial [Caulobacter segnis]